MVIHFQPGRFFSSIVLPCRGGITSGKPTCLVLIVKWCFPSRNNHITLDSNNAADIGVAVDTGTTDATNVTGDIYNYYLIEKHKTHIPRKWRQIVIMLENIACFLAEYVDEYGIRKHPKSKARWIIVDLEHGLNYIHALERPCEVTLSFQDLLQLSNWQHSPLVEFREFGWALEDLNRVLEAEPALLSLQEYRAGLSHEQALIEFDSRAHHVTRRPVLTTTKYLAD